MYKKQVLALAIPYLLGTCVGIGIGIVGTLVWGPDAQAASYQFNFNNVEQGPGSTANPSLTVNGQEVKKSQGDQTTPTTTTQTQVSGDVSPKVDVTTASPATTATVAELRGVSSHRAFRLGLDGQFIWGNAGAGFGGGLSASWLPVEGLGLTVFGGLAEFHQYLGGELELTPLRLSLFGLRDLAEVGVMAGVSTQGRGIGLWGSAHLGARAALNLGDRFSIVASMRQNVTNRDRQVDTTVGAGLTVRF